MNVADHAIVMTVNGPVPANQIGFTLPHEHPYCKLRQAEHRYDFPDQFEDDDVVASEVVGFRELGGGTMVDLTTPSIGRDPERLRELSNRTGIKIVMGCGWYRGSYYRPEDRLDRRPVADLADELIREITEGVGPSRIRPGVIGEIGSEKTWVWPVEERVLRAAARAQRSTGLAIGALHSIGPVAHEQLTILEDEGADLSRVAVGHCESMAYFDYLVGLIGRGVYVMFDNCGSYRTLGNFEDHICDLIRRLIDAGHEQRILLSQDTCKFGQFRCHGGPGFTYLAETFLPKLRDLGIPDDVTTRMTNDNPRRWLGLPA
jgi:predicted metal-dependent phosphotriesterase family hydrolase